ncbi:thiamine diphosphokinase [Sulfitobacter albidus]|uniref:Thiamine diphosphokinase n=1 Tax=Sulfitobacter albidus TaxID=2829501 RepID=A0A975PMT8_9RHOB|nr:thiamine diphosphokinase [Sulfitobacter albidus]QUJ77148.1 thiamine diphosphokinase [Sulfitobacter albidus]
MSKLIIDVPEPITLVGGGQGSAADLAETLTMAPHLVAVDGGLSLALEVGTDPLAVIGDMDSVAPGALARIPPERQHRVSEQQTTDFDKALRAVRAPVVVGVGFGGGRVDHQLAAFHTLLVHAERPTILLAEDEIVVLAPPRVTLDCRAGETVSLFPMVAVTGTSRGLEWPIDGLDFHPAQFIGTSNRATGPVEIEMHAPGMLLIVARRHLRPLVAQFSQGGARWPARAG